MRHDPGLAASPPVRYRLKVEEWVLSFSLHRPLWTDNLLAKRRRAAYGGTAGSGGSPMGWAEPAKRRHDTEHAGDDTN